ncbi:MAG: right-handed parallel beta-helix repeat-containing protein [Draconibacterium sp.]
MNQKKWISGLLLLILVISVSSAKEIYVSPVGNDNNPGTKKQPFKTLFQAEKTARQLMIQGKVNDITVWLADGIYGIDNPFIIKPFREVSCEYKLQFKADKNANPVVSGGIQITGWKKNEEGLWTARLPENAGNLKKVRELFIDGKRAVRARHPNKDFLRIKKAGADRRTHFYFEKDDFPIPVKAENVELVLLHDWSISRIAVKEINISENKLTAVDSIGARNPDFFNLDHWEPNPRYFLENAPEFLDENYEWVYQPEEKQFFVKLPDEVNPAQLQVVVPLAEGLISIVGEENQPVKNVTFEGIAFQYCNWQIPEMGYCGVQACHFDPRPIDNGWAVVPAAVHAVWAENLRFKNCKFKNLGGSGLWFSTGCKNCSIENSVFSDISGNGIMIGEGQDRTVNGEPWWKSAPEQVALANKIEDCTVTECGAQYYGAVGIWCGLTAETVIRNNEIFNLPYSGVSVGWMWSPEPTPCRKNTIEGNHIHHIMNILSDGGGIYMLGLQPGSVIRNNHIHDVEINAGRAESNGMFLDEGITDVLVENNLIYNIAKSPLRFHKATKNLVKGNYLFCTGENPPIRYNSTKEEDIEKVDNKVVNEGKTGYETTLKKAIKNWKY